MKLVETEKDNRKIGSDTERGDGALERQSGNMETEEDNRKTDRDVGSRESQTDTWRQRKTANRHKHRDIKR